MVDFNQHTRYFNPKLHDLVGKLVYEETLGIEPNSYDISYCIWDKKTFDTTKAVEPGDKAVLSAFSNSKGEMSYQMDLVEGTLAEIISYISHEIFHIHYPIVEDNNSGNILEVKDEAIAYYGMLLVLEKMGFNDFLHKTEDSQIHEKGRNLAYELRQQFGENHKKAYEFLKSN